jgi:hypothetical protein
LDRRFTGIEIYLSDMTARGLALGVLRAVKTLHKSVALLATLRSRVNHNARGTLMISFATI